MNISNYLQYFLWNCLDILLIIRYMNRTYKIRKYRKCIFYLFAFCIVLFTTISMRPTSNYLNLMAITAMSSLLLVIYEGLAWQKLLFSFLLLIISAFWSAISYSIAKILPYWEDLFAMLFCYAGIGIVLEIVPYFHLKKAGKLPLNMWILLFSIPIVSIPAFFCIMIFSGYDLNYQSRLACILLMGILLLINILVFYLFERFSSLTMMRVEKALLEQQIVLQEKYYAILHTNQQEIKSTRHDMKNQLETARYLLQEHKYEDLQGHLKSLTNHIEMIDQVVNTHNIAMDSILNMKFTEMKQNNIAVDKKITVPEHLNLSFENAAIILGNILDNAKEACLLFPIEIRCIRLRISYQTNMLFIRLENPSKEINLGHYGIPITDKQNASNHGYGLKNVKKTVEQLHGTMEMSCAEGKFQVKIMIYDQ